MKKAIKRGAVLVDGQVATTAHWVKPGQRVALQEADRQAAKVYEIPIEILFEDEHLAVVFKPAGLVVSGNQFCTLENALPHNLQASTLPDALLQPRPVHRLDGPTSGLLLVAKCHTALVDLSRQFEEKKIKKRYQAIVTGKIGEEGVIDSPLNNKPSLTKYKRIKTVPSLKNEWVSLVELYPETGRTHQIRLHLSGIGHPIMGDKLYGEKGKILWKKGLFLSALGLLFTHPANGEKLTIAAKLPNKFALLLAREERRHRDVDFSR